MSPLLPVTIARFTMPVLPLQPPRFVGSGRAPDNAECRRARPAISTPPENGHDSVLQRQCFDPSARVRHNLVTRGHPPSEEPDDTAGNHGRCSLTRWMLP